VPVVAQPDDDAATAVARTYRAFARLEARGRSAAYEALADSVADDAMLAGFIASLPPLPARMPVISWRAGLDLNPLDVTRDGQVIAFTESHGTWLRWLS
jgi:hypothetical protein